MTSNVTAAPVTSAPLAGTTVQLRWWTEVAIVLGFYAVYTSIRNLFGSAAVDPNAALENAEFVIRIERWFGLFQEERLQGWFLSWRHFLQFWNMFYGTFHFAVTAFVLIYLFRRHPQRYRWFRSALAITTGLALVGFSAFPLMPPRLLGDCGVYGGCAPGYGFVDSLIEFGGLWSFDSGAMQSVSNQYAAMPSLHCAWATWCAMALIPVIRNRSARAALALYPWLTLFAVVVTANHYWIDAVGGLAVLAAGLWGGARFVQWRDARGRAL